LTETGSCQPSASTREIRRKLHTLLGCIIVSASRDQRVRQDVVEPRSDRVILFGFPQQLHRLLNPAQRHEEGQGKIIVDNRIVRSELEGVAEALLRLRPLSFASIDGSHRAVRFAQKRVQLNCPFRGVLHSGHLIH